MELTKDTVINGHKLGHLKAKTVKINRCYNCVLLDECNYKIDNFITNSTKDCTNEPYHIFIYKNKLIRFLIIIKSIIKRYVKK